MHLALSFISWLQQWVSWRTSRVAEVTECDGADDTGVDAVRDPLIFVLLVPICKQTSTSPASAHTQRWSVDFQIARLPDCRCYSKAGGLLLNGED